MQQELIVFLILLNHKDIALRNLKDTMLSVANLQILQEKSYFTRQQ